MKFLTTAVVATASIAALSAVAISAQTQKTYDIKVSKDATILRSTVSCPNCPERNCYKCTLGADPTLVVSNGGLAVNYALLGFTLPSETIGRPDRLDKCLLELPASTTNLTQAVTLPISAAASPFWDEYSVSGSNAPTVGDNIGSVVVPSYNGVPAQVDLTAACKAASTSGAGFSIYIDPYGANYVQFPSKEGGQASYLHVTIH
ncbi:hypothetical protein EV182_003314 [Spiromyces aspiralis]|uniref:Uncharacterized protein n=1 Tax=Spiromyces aspiralis TaxID=68401 RepID=A0ACC1HQL0_9FUNG|nr:hypothetical protein EV182_003314 [Spiromyces aspiralis]